MNKGGLITTLQTRFKSLELDKLLYYARFDVPSHYVLKNSKTLRKNSKGKLYPGSTDKQLILKQHYMFQLRRFTGNFDVPIDGPVQLMIHFHLSHYFTNKGKVSKNLPDLSNLYQGPEDCLEKAGIIINDRQIENHDGSRRIASDKDEVEIFLLRAGDQ